MFIFSNIYYNPLFFVLHINLHMILKSIKVIDSDPRSFLSSLETFSHSPHYKSNSFVSPIYKKELKKIIRKFFDHVIVWCIWLYKYWNSITMTSCPVFLIQKRIHSTKFTKNIMTFIILIVFVDYFIYGRIGGKIL